MPDPPSALHAALIRAFDEWAAARRAPGVGQRVLAALKFDGFANAALAGARGGSATDRQLLFGTDVADLAFHILRAHDDRMVIDGQLLLIDDDADTDADLALVAIAVDGDGEVLTTVRTDEVGQFRFDSVPVGNYVISIDLGDLQIDVGPFEVTASQ